jgi:hypothetical protein
MGRECLLLQRLFAHAPSIGVSGVCLGLTFSESMMTLLVVQTPSSIKAFSASGESSDGDLQKAAPDPLRFAKPSNKCRLFLIA